MINQLESNSENIIIGIGTYASSPPLLRTHHNGNKIIIGKYCSLASDVTIFSGGNHPINFISTHPLKLYFGVDDFSSWSKDCGDNNDITKIGNDVWIGHQALILSGVTVGDGAIIGARAVIAKDVPPYSIVVGNPGKIVKYRFNWWKRKKLMRSRWWDWEESRIKNYLSIICSKNLNKLEG